LTLSSRARFRVILSGLIALLTVLFLGGFGYWSYVHVVPPFHPLLPPLPTPNGYDRAAAIAAGLDVKYRGSKLLPWPQKIPAERPEGLAELRPDMDAMRATFRLEWRLRPGPNLHRIRLSPGFGHCARCFWAEGVEARHRGDAGAAMQAFLDAVELGYHLSRGADISQRGWANLCADTGFNPAERVAPQMPRTAIQAALMRIRRLRETWPPISDMLQRARVEELAWSYELFRSGREMAWFEWISHSKPSKWERLRLAWTPRRVVLTNLDRYYLQLIAESEKPVRQRVIPPMPTDGWSQRIAPIMSYDPNDAWEWNRVPTDLALIEVALAVRMHRLREGQYPEHLGDVSPRWLPAVPRDLWNQPIVYRLHGGQPVVYSLGPDGQDDGGQAINPHHLVPTARGDLVFGKVGWSRWGRATY
jgi:hypothetical protein